jgi:hypothetical protein
MSEAPSRPTARRGRTLKLYLADGTPTGVITAELGVSSVRAAVASRTALPELIRREEAARTGICWSAPIRICLGVSWSMSVRATR